MGSVTYKIHMPDQKQTFHINMLKKWHPCPTISPPEVHSFFIKAVRQEEEPAEQYLPGPQGETRAEFERRGRGEE